MKKGDIFETDYGIAIVVSPDDEYPHLIHLIIGKRNSFVLNLKTGEVEDYFYAILNIAFSDIVLESSYYE